MLCKNGIRTIFHWEKIVREEGIHIERGKKVQIELNRTKKNINMAMKMSKHKREQTNTTILLY